MVLVTVAERCARVGITGGGAGTMEMTLVEQQLLAVRLDHRRGWPLRPSCADLGRLLLALRKELQGSHAGCRRVPSMLPTGPRWLLAAGRRHR
jgi:hypothetical protein